jgi:hypothetical protein
MRDAINEKLIHFKERGIKSVEMTYDSAARWLRNELNEIEQEWWLAPCDKSNGLQGEISVWRGVLAHGHFIWTDAVPKMRWEMENYILDEKGRLPDKDDHAWQAGVYSLIAMGFDFTERLEQRTIQKEEPRFFRMEDEILPQNSYEDLD